jgi:ribonuclease-3
MEKGLQEKGTITRTKEQLEDNHSLAKIGRRMKIKRYIRLGRGEKDLWQSGEETILADTMEAIIGAIFLDSDASLGVVRQCIGTWFESELAQIKREELPKKKTKSPLSSISRRARPR